MTFTDSSQLLEICQLNTFLTFNSGLSSHVILAHDELRDILLFMLSILV